MKKLLIPLFIIINAVCYGQDIFGEDEPDTLIASRFIEDSVGNTYEIEYKYEDEHPKIVSGGDILHSDSGYYLIYNKGNVPYPKDGDTVRQFHRHYISLINIIAYKGNRKKTLFSNIKSIYSPVECVADNRELWLKRLYLLQNKK